MKILPISVQTDLSATKAIAVVLMVLSLSGTSGWIQQLGLLGGLPLLFAGMGYCMEDGKNYGDYLLQLFKKVYVPFVIWSVVFVILHTPLHYLGLTGGGPFSLHETGQRCWEIVFSLCGYDENLCALYWVFRAMLFSGIGFIGLYLLWSSVFKDWSVQARSLGVLVTVWLIFICQIGMGWVIPAIDGGGHRELFGVVLVAAGFLLRQQTAAICRFQLWVLMGSVVTIVLSLVFLRVDLLALPDFWTSVWMVLPMLAFFMLSQFFSVLVGRMPAWFGRAFRFVGNHALLVVGFCLLSFKLVSLLKVVTGQMNWEGMSAGFVMPDSNSGWFFSFLYLLVGIGGPLGGVLLWRKADTRYNLTWTNCLKYSLKGLILAFVWSVKLILKFFKGAWNVLKETAKDAKGMLKASNPNEE